MKAKHVYLLLCVAGTVLPYLCLWPFLLEHGLDVRALLGEVLANRVAGFFAVDLVVSALALWAWVLMEGKSAGVRTWWAPFIATVLVGVSLGLPLYLYLRERRSQERVVGLGP